MFPPTSTNPPSVTMFLLLAISTSILALTTAKPKFILSCRVIGGICQGDVRCLDEMSAHFPDCYLEGQFDLLSTSRNDVFPPPAIIDGFDSEEQQQHMLMMPKRAPAMKLMKVLMMKDRIPVGRR